MINELTRAVLASLERTCAECSKTFIIQNSEYTYKINISGRVFWFCCYSHWIKHYKKALAKKASSQERYVLKLIEAKNKNNARRRKKL